MAVVRSAPSATRRRRSPAKDRRLRALALAVAAYESEFGPITDAELTAQERVSALEQVCTVC